MDKYYEKKKNIWKDDWAERQKKKEEDDRRLKEIWDRIIKGQYLKKR